MQFDVHAHWNHADHIGCATTTEHFESLFGGGFQTDSFKRMVYTAAGQLHDLCHGVTIFRIDDIRCAELFGKIEF